MAKGIKIHSFSYDGKKFDVRKIKGKPLLFVTKAGRKIRKTRKRRRRRR